jgi:two-component system, NarL family, nitrate/nitrite response regulator NarL
MRVLVVSNHTLLGQSLLTMLQSLPAKDAVEARVCRAADMAVIAREWPPDVIMVEAIVHLAAALATVRTSVKALPDARMLVLGTENDEETIYAAITAGADGYLPQDTSPVALLATLRGMARGELGLSRTAARTVLRRLRCAVAAQPEPVSTSLIYGQLTQREREIFELVRRGMRSREIADELSIAEGTVYKHIQNILEKLHAHNRAHAIFVAESRAVVDRSVVSHST